MGYWAMRRKKQDQWQIPVNMIILQHLNTAEKSLAWARNYQLLKKTQLHVFDFRMLRRSKLEGIDPVA